MPAATWAADWQTEAGDQRLSKAELTELVSGKTLEYEGGAKSVLDDADGYEFHVGGEVYPYTYDLTDNGEICIVSADFGARCDLIVVNDGQVISINDQGERFVATVK